MAIGYWGYPNGEIPASALTEAGGVLLREDVARQARAWIRELGQMGINLWFSEGNRDLATQRYWRTWWCNRGQCGNAAVPGTSNHGWAMAVDMHSGSYGNNSNSSTYQTIVAVGRKYGFTFNVRGEPWHGDWNGPVSAWASDDGINPVTAEELELMTRVDALESRINEVLSRIDTIVRPDLVNITNSLGRQENDEEQLKSAIRREVRGRLYHDTGENGSVTEANASRAAVINITAGFIYPLNADPKLRPGQLSSLRKTPYQLISSDEKSVGLPTHQFNNLLEMANGHLRRAGVAAAEQLLAVLLATGVIPEDKEDEAVRALSVVTSVNVPKNVNPTPALKQVDSK